MMYNTGLVRGRRPLVGCRHESLLHYTKIPRNLFMIPRLFHLSAQQLGLSESIELRPISPASNEQIQYKHMTVRLCRLPHTMNSRNHVKSSSSPDAESDLQTGYGLPASLVFLRT